MPVGRPRLFQLRPDLVPCVHDGGPCGLQGRDDVRGEPFDDDGGGRFDLFPGRVHRVTERLIVLVEGHEDGDEGGDGGDDEENGVSGHCRVEGRPCDFGGFNDGFDLGEGLEAGHESADDGGGGPDGVPKALEE